MWSGGLALHRQTAIAVSADIRKCIEVVIAWSHGISLDCALDALPTRLVNAHLPNSWRPLHELAEPLIALDGILAEASSAGKRIVLAGVGRFLRPPVCRKPLRTACLQKQLAESGSGVPTALSLEVAGTDNIQSNYICISHGLNRLIAERTGEKLIDYATSDHDCIEVSGASRVVCRHHVWCMPVYWDPPNNFGTFLADLPRDSLQKFATSTVALAKTRKTFKKTFTGPGCFGIVSPRRWLCCGNKKERAQARAVPVETAQDKGEKQAASSKVEGNVERLWARVTFQNARYHGMRRHHVNKLHTQDVNLEDFEDEEPMLSIGADELHEIAKHMKNTSARVDGMIT
eukprot:2888258-Amphidinium_carterae.3